MANYRESREQFLRLAERLEAKTHSHEVPVDGSSEPLSIDVAIWRHAPGAPTVIATSGLHGVEGLPGSAVQLAAMEKWVKAGLPEDVNIVFAHALNPYGFANDRRFDQLNVDLNRNFRSTFDQPVASDEAYGRYDRLLNPRSKPSRIDLFYGEAILTVLRHGFRRAASAVVIGQYSFPKGLFFGGREPSISTQILQSSIDKWVEGSNHIVHVDFHTGLGKRGVMLLLVDQELSSTQKQELEMYFGDKQISWFDRGSVLYRAVGGYGQWCVEHFKDRSYIYLCAETGTYSSFRVLAGLRNENRLTHWFPDETKKIETARAQLRELFCPADLEWRQNQLQRGLEVLDQSVRYSRARERHDEPPK